MASHLIVGGLLRLAMSAGAGPAFAIALAVLIRAGLRALDNPLLYVRGEAAGGALLYLIMMEGVAPHLNRTIVEAHPATTVFPRSPRLSGPWSRATCNGAPGAPQGDLRVNSRRRISAA